MFTFFQRIVWPPDAQAREMCSVKGKSKVSRFVTCRKCFRKICPNLITDFQRYALQSASVAFSFIPSSWLRLKENIPLLLGSQSVGIFFGVATFVGEMSRESACFSVALISGVATQKTLSLRPNLYRFGVSTLPVPRQKSTNYFVALGVLCKNLTLSFGRAWFSIFFYICHIFHSRIDSRFLCEFLSVPLPWI